MARRVHVVSWHEPRLGWLSWSWLRPVRHPHRRNGVAIAVDGWAYAVWVR